MAKGNAQKQINERTAAIKAKLEQRFAGLTTAVNGINNHTSLQTLNQIHKALTEPVKLSDTLSISIEECHPSSGKYKRSLPEGYQKAITLVEKAIAERHAHEVTEIFDKRMNKALADAQQARGVPELEEVKKAAVDDPLVLSDGTKVKASKLTDEQIAQAKPFQKNLEAVDKVLAEFKSKVDGIGAHKAEAQVIAQKLYNELQQAKSEAFKDPDENKLANFATKASQLIKTAIPALQKDLGWGDYLKNMLKKIGNAVTLGLMHGFFQQKKSGAVDAAEKLDTDLQEGMKPSPK